MTDLMKAALGGIGLIVALGIIISATLRHYIGGFLRTVEREAEEQAAREAEEQEVREAEERDALRHNASPGNTENTGEQR